MLNNPRYGWVEVQISDFFGACSDQTNVPRDTLECFIDYYEKGRGEAYYDQEGSEFTIILE